MKSSEELTIGTLYTREQLKQRFNIKATSIFTGVFRAPARDSIWLFITKQPAKHKTQYSNRLEGDHLYFDGQSEGGTDKDLIKHEKNGKEVLLFWRNTEREHSGGGFHYEGKFKYLSHTGTKPAHFHFRRAHSADYA